MKLKYYLRGLGIGIIVTTIILMISFSQRDNDVSDDYVIERAKELGMVMPEEDDTRDTAQQNGQEDTSQKQEENPTDHAQGDTSPNMAGNSKSANQQPKNSDVPKDTPPDSVVTDTENAPDTADGVHTGKPQRTDLSDENSTDTSKETKKPDEDRENASQKSEKPEQNNANAPQGSEKPDTGTESASSESQKPAADTAGAPSESQKPEANTAVGAGNPTGSQDSYRLVVKRGDVCRTICDTLKSNGLIEDSESFRQYLSGIGYASRLSTGSYDIPYGLTMEEVANVLIAGPVERGE